MKRNFIINIAILLLINVLLAENIYSTQEKIEFTKEEKQLIKELQKKGGIRAVTRKNDLIGDKENKNTLESFNYRVLKEICDMLEVDLKIEYVDIESFFYKEGRDVKKVISGEDDGYTPDIFKRADIIMANLTVAEWRKKLIKFIEIAPNRQILVTQNDTGITNLKALNGKKFVTVRYTTMENTMKEIEKKCGIKVEYIYTDKLIEMEKMVEEGKADLTIDDAISAVMYIKSSKKLKINFPVSGMEYIGWGVSKESGEFSALISKCLKIIEKKGKLSKEWVRFYGIGMSEYKKMIEY